MRITFSKGKAYDGLARLPKTYAVKMDGKEVATIQKLEKHAYMASGETLDDVKCWFWYGDSVNTCSKPSSLEDCKAAVKAHFKAKAKA